MRNLHYKLADWVEFEVKPRLRIIKKAITERDHEVINYMQEADYFNYMCRQSEYGGLLRAYREMGAFAKHGPPIDSKFCAEQAEHIKLQQDAIYKDYWTSKGVTNLREHF